MRVRGCVEVRVCVCVCVAVFVCVCIYIYRDYIYVCMCVCVSRWRHGRCKCVPLSNVPAYVSVEQEYADMNSPPFSSRMKTSFGVCILPDFMPSFCWIRKHTYAHK